MSPYDYNSIRPTKLYNFPLPDWALSVPFNDHQTENLKRRTNHGQRFITRDWSKNKERFRDL